MKCQIRTHIIQGCGLYYVVYKRVLFMWIYDSLHETESLAMKRVKEIKDGIDNKIIWEG